MWQTIETAPKDGTKVLLFVPANEPKVCFGFFNDTETFSYGVSYSKSQGWILTAGGSGWAEPTHWQPLPADPE